MEPEPKQDLKSKDCVCVTDVLASNSHVELAKTSHGLMFRAVANREADYVDIDAAQLVRWIVGPGRNALADHGVYEAMAHLEAKTRLDVAERTFPKLHERLATLQAERDDLASRVAVSDGLVASAQDACVQAGFSLEEVRNAGIARIVQTLGSQRRTLESDLKRSSATIGVVADELAVTVAGNVRDAIRQLKRESELHAEHLKALLAAAGRDPSEKTTITWEQLITDVQTKLMAISSDGDGDIIGVIAAELTTDITAATVRTAIRALKREVRDATADRDAHARNAVSLQAFREKVCAVLRCGPNVAEAVDKITRLSESVTRLESEQSSPLATERMAHAETKRQLEEACKQRDDLRSQHLIGASKLAREHNEHLLQQLASEKEAHVVTKRAHDDLLSSVSQALIDAYFMPEAGGSCVEAIKNARKLLDEANDEIAALTTDDEDDEDDEDQRDLAMTVAGALHTAIEVDEFDWTSKKAHAFVYQIVVGCDRATLEELAGRYGWGTDTTDYLVTLHEAFQELMHGTSVP